MIKDKPQAPPENDIQDVSLESLEALLRRFIFNYLEESTPELVELHRREYSLSEYDLGLPSERVRLSHDIQQDMKTLAGLKKLRAHLKIRK